MKRKSKDDKIRMELIKDYLAEANEALDNMDPLLLRLEDLDGKDPDPRLITQILSLLHTFKGNSGMMGFASVEKFTHKLEDFFKGIQSNQILFDQNAEDLVIWASGVLRESIEVIAQDPSNTLPVTDEILVLENFLSNCSKDGETLLNADFKRSSKRPNIFNKKLNILKVDFNRLETLHNLMGELVIQRTRLGKVNTGFKDNLRDKNLKMELDDTTEKIGKVTVELHDAINKIWMQPLKHVFMRFPMLARELAREKGKKIDLRFEGEETELDKSVIDEIGEPLLHLLRNAVDHGIEMPMERERMGKPPQGIINVRAVHKSSHVILSIEDDGCGIDVEKLKIKAEKDGILTEKFKENLIDLIFVPGFSSKKTISEISGRGIGMDIVKNSLASLNGIIEVESKINRGTCFTIKIPLTLANASALLIEVSDEIYAVPMLSVVKSIKLDLRKIHLINNSEVLHIDGQVIPIIRLSEYFGLTSSHDNKKMYVLIVKNGTSQAGIMVNSIIGRQEIVIKNLDDYLGKSPGITGSTILGDGKIVLIIDIPEIIEGVKQTGFYHDTMECRAAINKH